MKKLITRQKGAALIIFAVIFALAATAFLISRLDGESIKIERDKKTAAVLAEAKVALIGFAARSGTAIGTDRPGELPCPDTTNDGDAELGCGGNAFGRLPWRTLRIDDLRDGDGERLWYAVSVNFKRNPKVYPLNSDTVGTITMRDSSNNIINNGLLDDGLTAIVLSAGVAIRRQDNIDQVRDNAANQNNPINYLDIAFGEDNQGFINGDIDGFIKGPIKDVNGNVIVNDKMVSISHEELLVPVEQRVIAEVSNALLDFYCFPDNADYINKICDGTAGNQYYPNPALFSDISCFGNVNINAPACPSNAGDNRGRLPVDISLPTNPTLAWNISSILRGSSVNNWFQRNGWREQIYYSVAPACVEGTLNCNGVGFLTLNFARTNPASRIIVTASGRTYPVRARITNIDKINETNYLEEENILPLDDVFTRTVPTGVIFNDRSVNIPQ